MKSYFRDLSIQVGAAIYLGILVVGAVHAAGQFIPNTPFF